MAPPITHKHEPDASMPGCRNLSAFLGKPCLAQGPLSPRASQKHLGKRSTRNGAPVADPSTFTSQLSILKLLSRHLAKHDPSAQSFGNGIRAQIRENNPKVASSCTVSVCNTSLSEERRSLEAEVGQNVPEQMVMAQQLQLCGDEVTELDSVESAKVKHALEQLETHKLIDVSKSLPKEKDYKEFFVVLEEVCPLEAGESQVQASVLKLQGTGSFVLSQGSCVDHSSSNSVSIATKMQVSEDNLIVPLIDQQQEAQPHMEHPLSPDLQSPQAQESSEMVHYNLVTSQELCIVNTNIDELQFLASANLPQNDGDKIDFSAGKFDTATAPINIFSFSMAKEQAQGCKEDKSSLTCQQNKQGQKGEGDMRRSFRKKKLFNTGEHHDSSIQTIRTNFHKKEQEASKVVASSSLHDNIPEFTRSDFFLPASRKSKKQKVSEETSIPVSDKPVLREKRPREEKAGVAQKRNAGISAKQASSSGEFFKPALKRQKQILNTKADERLDSTMKTEKADRTSFFEFDLWTEAKIASEENAKLCLGKPTHPFFSQHKGGQRASILVSLPANSCSSQQASSFEEIELTPAPPFHITQLPKAEIRTTDIERCTFLRICQNLKVDPVTSKRDADREELNALLKIPLVNKLCKTPRHRRDYPSGRRLLDNVLEPLLTFLKDFESNSKENIDQDKFDFSSAYLEDRLKLCLSDRAKRCSEVSLEFTCTDEGSAQKSLLWTDVYQPQSPKQVCGNRDSVNILSAWLEKWQAGGSPFSSAERDATSRKISNNDSSDEDHYCFQEDSDSEGNTKEDAMSQNVLFLAGPVGCGKTAAIYACARAHGFTVIEVNCSDNRNGLLIKQKFSESMESHRLDKWSAEATGPDTAPSCTTRDTLAAADTNVAENPQHVSNQKRRNQKQKQKQKTRTDPTSTSKLLKNKAVPNPDGGPALQPEQYDFSTECDKSLTVLLFEDIDMVFEDDRGFIAAVAQVAATAKRPIILTSNDNQLCLPHRLGADLLEFKKPSTRELVVLSYLICVAEGISCRPEILLQMVKLCKHDLRLLLNYLQFWSQGHNRECPSKLEDVEPSVKLESKVDMQSTSKSEAADSAAIIKLFELEAQHRLWPSCVSLELACPVTQAVACELNAKVSQVERESNIEEEKKLEHFLLEKLALMKKLKRQKIDSPLRAEKAGLSNDFKELTAEESDNLETPVKNLKDAKAVARSPVLREKLKKDLAATMFGSAANVDHLDENNQTVFNTPCKHESGEDDLSSIPSAGTAVLDGGASIIAPSLIGKPSEHEVYREPLTNDADNETESMPYDVLIKASSQSSTLNNQPFQNLRCDPGESKLQRISESVSTLWSDFRHNKEKQGLLLSSSCKESFETTLLLSDMLDNLSVCDVMSGLLATEKTMPGNLSYSSSCCESLEYSNILEACSMVAHRSLLLCIEESWASQNFQEEVKNKLSIEDMMLAVNDPCALGKLVTGGDGLLPSSRGLKLQNVAPPSQEQDIKRHEKKSSLYHALYDALPLKMQVFLQRSSFIEDASFLARIGLLERERLTSGGMRRRGRGFQNYFQTHPWNLSKESINIIEQFGKFQKPYSADL